LLFPPIFDVFSHFSESNINGISQLQVCLGLKKVILKKSILQFILNKFDLGAASEKK